MKEFVLISIVATVMSFCGFAQMETPDSMVYTDHCECLEDVYNFKKEFMENISATEDRIKLDSTFIEKYSFTWEKFRSIDSQCFELKQRTDQPCSIEGKLIEISEEFELVRRVIEMRPPPPCEIDTKKEK